MRLYALIGLGGGAKRERERDHPGTFQEESVSARSERRQAAVLQGSCRAFCHRFGTSHYNRPHAPLPC